jgi:hypothetical protein
MELTVKVLMSFEISSDESEESKGRGEQRVRS